MRYEIEQCTRNQKWLCQEIAINESFLVTTQVSCSCEILLYFLPVRICYSYSIEETANPYQITIVALGFLFSSPVV